MPLRRSAFLALVYILAFQRVVFDRQLYTLGLFLSLNERRSVD